MRSQTLRLSDTGIVRSTFAPVEPFDDVSLYAPYTEVDDVSLTTEPAPFATGVIATTVVEAPAGRYDAYNVASGHPIPILDVARLVAAGTADPVEPEVTGGYRLGDVRHIVASPARASAELGFSAAVLPEQGLAAFATAPLRA